MATRKRPAGGVGSNQYQTVGTPTASAPAGRVAAFSAPTASDVRNVELVRQSDGTYRDRAGRYELARYMRRSDRSRKLVQDGWDLTDREHGRTTWVAGLDTARAHVEQLRDQEDALVAALASTERKGAVRYLPSADGTDVVVELAARVYPLGRFATEDRHERVTRVLDRLGIGDRVHNVA